MDYYTAKDVFDSMNPGKVVTYDFDKNCLRKTEFIWNNGELNDDAFSEFDKVRITVEGQDPVYVPINTHRQADTIEFHKNLLG